MKIKRLDLAMLAAFAVGVAMMAGAVQTDAAPMQTINDNPCQATPGGTVFAVTSGRPYRIGWVLPATGPANASDPTPVPNRVNGFYVALDDQQAKVDIGLPAPAGPPCPAGTSYAGMIPYEHTMSAGVGRGEHRVFVSAWNYVVAPNGIETLVKQESEVASVPFVGVDLMMYGPPMGPINPVIKR